MLYTVVVRDPETRRVEIAAHCETTTNRRRCYEMSQPQELPVIRLDLRTPIYRMANFRTHSRQQARVRQQDLPEDWFLAGQENELQQAVQHELLTGLAETGSGETIIPITEALRRDRTQKQPLLLTADGVVVNGNRRLAAIRELFTSNANLFASFAQVEAMILPANIDPAEIKRIEVRLQMTPQTLLPYDWIDQAQAVRELLQSGFTRNEVAELMQLTEPAIRAILGRLDEADLYLSECAGTPGDYLSIMMSEQHFKEMEKGLRDKRGTAKLLARRIGQAVLKNASQFPQRIYDYRVLWNQNFDRAVPLLAEQLEIEEQPPSETTEDPEDIFSGATDDLTVWSGLGPALIDPNNQEEVAAAIRATADIIIDENRGATTLESLRRIQSQLSSINLGQAAPETLPQIVHELEQLQRRCAALLSDAEGRIEALQEVG